MTFRIVKSLVYAFTKIEFIDFKKNFIPKVSLFQKLSLY